MTFKQWVRDAFGPESRAAGASRRGKSRRPARRGWVPMVELLEGRRMLTAYMVTSAADSGPGTLRQAIMDSETNHVFQEQDTIQFSSSLDGQTINLTTFINDNSVAGPSAFAINNSEDLVIDGESGLANGITIARDTVAADYADHTLHNFRLFFVDTGSALTLKGLTLTGGSAKGGDGGGGGGAGGGGAAGMGGAIFNEGDLKILDSTLTGNTATGGNGSAGSTVDGGGGGGGLGSDGNSGIFVDNPFPTGDGFYGAGGNGGGPHGGAGSTDPLSPNGIGGQFGGGGGGGYGFGDISSGFVPFYGNGGSGGFGAGGGGGGSGDEFGLGGQGGNGGFGGGGGGGGYYTYGGAGGGFGGGTGNGNNGGGGAGMGGAIFNYKARVTITTSTLEGNNAFAGQAGNNNAAVAAKGLGGGVFNFDGVLEVTNSTLAENYAPNDGGGIYSVDGGAGSPEADAFLNNTIVANSYRSTDDTLVSPSDVKIALNGGASKIAGDWNLIGTSSIATNAINTIADTLTGDPKLGPLQYNGGWTQTMALQAGSPAIDSGGSTTFSFLDQRGIDRVGTRDIGAFEFGALFPQTISFAALAGKTYGDADFTISATATSKLPVTFTASGNASVSEDNNGVWTVHILGAGTATITAYQAGTDIFGAATDVDQSLTINKADATVVVTPYSVIYDGQPHTATVTSITGVNGETGATVGAVDVTGTTHTSAGNYSNDFWSFTGTNYNAISHATITDNIALALSALPDWTVNRPYTPEVTTAGGTGKRTFTLASGTLPTGLTLHSDGSFSGSPKVTGPFTFTILATQGATATGTRTYTVTINAVPTVSNLTVTQWTQGKSGFTGTMTITGGTPSFAIVGPPIGLPPGLNAVLSGNTISFSGKPIAPATFNGSITIKDLAGAQVTKKFTIKINPALTFTPPQQVLVYVPGKSYSQTFKTSGGTGVRTVSYELAEPLPTGLIISPPSPTTGAITISGKTSVKTKVKITMTVTDEVGAQTTITYTLQSAY